MPLKSEIYRSQSNILLYRKGARHILEKSRSVLSFSHSIDATGGNEVVPQSKPQNNVPEEETKSGWVEHTWSTFIARAEDDVTETLKGKLQLSEFQKKKFVYFFYHVLDLNSDHVISQEDFDGLNSRVRHYMDWNVNHPQYLTLIEVHSLFIEHFLKTASKFVVKEEGFDFGEQIEDESEDEKSIAKESISIDEWVDVWGETVGEARKPEDLPMWLQFYPKTLFDTINRSASGSISKKELKLFYTAFIDAGKLGDEALNELTEKSYNAMTANGDAKLTYHTYQLSFLNFLLGRQPNGPGQFMFGTVSSHESPKWIPVEFTKIPEPQAESQYSKRDENVVNSNQTDEIIPSFDNISFNTTSEKVGRMKANSARIPVNSINTFNGIGGNGFQSKLNGLEANSELDSRNKRRSIIV